MVNKTTGRRYAPPKKRVTTARKEMTVVEKGMIIAFFQCLGSIVLVARIIGRPWSTVKSFLVRACECLSIDNLPRSGCPPALSRQQRRTIVREAKSNRKMTRTQFRETYAPGVSLATGKAGVISHDF